MDCRKQQTPVALFTTVIAFYHCEQMTIRMITYVLVIDDCMAEFSNSVWSGTPSPCSVGLFQHTLNDPATLFTHTHIKLSSGS